MDNNQILNEQQWRHHTGASSLYVRPELQRKVDWEDAKQNKIEIPEVRKTSFFSQLKGVFTIFSILN